MSRFFSEVLPVDRERASVKTIIGGQKVISWNRMRLFLSTSRHDFFMNVAGRRAGMSTLDTKKT